MSSAADSNAAWVLSKRPKGNLSDELKLETVSGDAPQPADGQIVIKLTFISVDPYLRGRMMQLPLNEPMISGVTGEVIASKSDKFKVGDQVWWYGKWQRIQVVEVASAMKERQLSPVPAGAPSPSLALGVLGMPGFTAWSGLKFAASFKAGDRVIVTGAAGAVGSAVGQLAKQWGAKIVVGTAGGPEKCKLVVEKFGFDHCIDYKKFDTAEKVAAELKRINPDGFDVFFENTGGHVSDAIYNGSGQYSGLLRKFARVALCGNIANYNNTETNNIPNPFMNCIYTSIRIQGFVQTDYIQHWGEFLTEVGGLIKADKLKYEETVATGFDKAFDALKGLFHGANTGKYVVKV